MPSYNQKQPVLKNNGHKPLIFYAALRQNGENMMKRILALFLCAVMCLGALSSLAGCQKPGTVDGGETTDTVAEGESSGYSVTVSSTGGVNLEGIDVYIYTDEALSNLVGYAKTGADGVANLDIPTYDGYFIVLSGAPKGYNIERF